LDKLKSILEDIARGDISVEKGMELLRFLPYEGMDDVLFDHHRRLRKGFPEVIYGKGKSEGQLKNLLERLLVEDAPILVTRVGEAKALKLVAALPGLEYDHVARALYRESRKGDDTYGSADEDTNPSNGQEASQVTIVTAGTSDLPVASEASLTLKLMDIPHQRLIDVGVAGIHRLFSHLRILGSARVIICIAGMEGALPSIVAGLVKCPVIAVPTSTGYGSNMKGMVPLLAMLNSCAPGIGVVNIDNGFGAAALAASIIWS